MNNNSVKVTFTHPRDGGRSFDANINPQCTGQMAIQGLLLGDEGGAFLEAAAPGRPYELAVKRSQTNIPPNMTFEQAGVQDGDVIEVRQSGQGALRVCVVGCLR
jgi:hypothetical protein